MNLFYFKRIIVAVLLVPILYFSQNYSQEIIKIDKLRAEGNLAEAFKIIKIIEKDAAKNHREDLPKIYTAYMKYYFSAEDFKNAETYSQKALEIGSHSKNPVSQAYGYFAKSYYYYQLNVPETAMEFAKKSQKTLEKSRADGNLETALNYLFYCLHSQWNDASLSNQYAEKTIISAKKAKNYDFLANGYAAKATAMGFLNEKNNDKKINDSIIYYLRGALAIEKKYPQSVSERTAAIANLNLANAFYLEFKKEKSPAIRDSISKYLDNIGRLKNFNDYNAEIRANALGLHSQVATENGQTALAEHYLLDAYNLLNSEKKRPSYYALYNISGALEDLYKSTGQLQKSLDFADKKLEYSRKDFDETAAKNVRTLEAKYETEKIKTDLALSQKIASQKQIQNYLLIILVGFAFSTLYFLKKNFNNKIKLQNEIAENLHFEKKQAETALKLENETKARLLAEQKILRLEHEKITKEALANALKAEQKDELLQEISLQIGSQNLPNEIRNEIRKNSRIDGSLDGTIKDFEGIHPEFFEFLKKKSSGKLTVLDLRYCAYLYLGLGTKEIATIASVEPKTVRMSKYRIKQKLLLDKDTALEEFLQNAQLA